MAQCSCLSLVCRTLGLVRIKQALDTDFSDLVQSIISVVVRATRDIGLVDGLVRIGFHSVQVVLQIKVLFAWDLRVRLRLTQEMWVSHIHL